MPISSGKTDFSGLPAASPNLQSGIFIRNILEKSQTRPKRGELQKSAVCPFYQDLNQQNRHTFDRWLSLVGMRLAIGPH